MTQKTTKIIILATICALCHTNTIQASNFEGCSSIYLEKCQVCYLRKLDFSTGGCGPVVPESNHCAFFVSTPQRNASRCIDCKRGFTFDGSKPAGKKCIPSTLSKSCIKALVLNNKQTCFECENGYVFAGETDCTPASQVKHADPNCVWGGLATKSFVTCARCKDGYATAGNNPKCVPFRKGCLNYALRAELCQACNVYEGYYAQGYRGRCFHG